jgi:3-deoxy-D-manno-octulosonic-acid transferase
MIMLLFAAAVELAAESALLSPDVPFVPVVVTTDAQLPVDTAAPVNEHTALTSQMPAVRLMLTTFSVTSVERAVALPKASVALICSPINPAAGAVLARFP